MTILLRSAILLALLVTTSGCILNWPGPILEEPALEWIHSDEGRAFTAVPDATWLEDGSALLLDLRVLGKTRTFERLDPASGERRVVVDARKVHAQLAKLLASGAPSALEWPQAIDRRGHRAVYVHADDLFVLDLVESEVERWTSTDGVEEKSPRFSPDGSSLAFVRENELWVRDVATGAEKRLTKDGSDTTLNGTLSWVYWEELFGREDIAYWWSPDSTAIAFLQTDESKVSQMSYVGFEPAVPEVESQRYPKAGGVNPSVRVGIVEAVSGAVRWVDLSRDPYEYIARVKWLPDSRRLSIQTLNRDQTVLDLVLFDRDGKRLRRLLRETEAAWINVHDDLWFLERSERFLWASERSGHMHLYLYDLEGKLQGAVTQGDWALRSSSSSVFWMRQAVQAIDEDKGHVWFTALEKSPLEKHLYRVGLDGSGLERVTRADGTHRVSMRADGKYYLDDYSNLSTPPSLTLRSARAERLKWIAAPQGDLGGRFHTAERQLLTIPAADGFPLPAHVMRRRDLDLGERHPLILRVYGGPSAPLVSNSWEAAKYFDEILAHRGYVVVRVDNRSATAISKRLESAILHEGYGPGELRDLVAAVRWLKEQPWVDPERVGLWGWSGGGTFTLLAMTGSEEFRAGISVAPVTDWRYYDTLWAERFMKRPQDNAEGYAKVSLVKKAKDLHGRLLLVHGTHDDNVHLQHTWHFVDELIRARKLFDLMIYPTRKHSIGDDPARIHLYKTMLEFWQKNL